MSQWPSLDLVPAGVITSVSLEALGDAIFGSGSIALSSFASATLAANRALFIPFVLGKPFVVTQGFWVNGSAVAGTVDCGVYSNSGVRLGSTGATAQAGVSAIQGATLALTLGPGSYYMAIVLSSGSATLFRGAASADFLQSLGMAQQASASPLPATFTLANVSSAFLPMFGLTSRSFL